MSSKQPGRKKAAGLVVLPSVSPDAPPRCDYDLALHPHDLGHDVRLYGDLVEVPDKPTVTVGYSAGPDSGHEGMPMVAAGPRDDVLRTLADAGYQVPVPEATEGPADETPEADVDELIRQAEEERTRQAIEKASRRIEALAQQLSLETRRLEAAAGEGVDGKTSARRTWNNAFVLMPLKLLILSTRALTDGTAARMARRSDDERLADLQETLRKVLNQCLAELEARSADQSRQETEWNDLPLR